ncbi:MAG: hypothetical protein ACI9YE_001829, partial [Psychroserpens sp.]
KYSLKHFIVLPLSEASLLSKMMAIFLFSFKPNVESPQVWLVMVTVPVLNRMYQ